MAQFYIPCNWDYKLIESLTGHTYSLYGKLGYDEIGGGRPACKLPLPTKNFVEDYIKKVRSKGINFYYLLNSSCLGNKEFTRSGYRSILDLIGWIESTGANYITVAIPFLAELIKSRFPKIKISVSKMAFVSTVQQAKFWEELGVKEITLDPNITRNFKRLKQIRKAVKLDLALLVNEACLFHCPYVYYHVNSDSHASQSGNINAYICYSRLFCEKVFITKPEEIIKSRFIRPEDLGIYDGIGITKFKLVSRDRPTEWILNALKAYSKKGYNGNLADILGTFSLYKNIPEERMRLLKFNNRDTLLTLEKLRKTNLLRPEIYIDNRALDGFLDFFRRFNCETIACYKCTYCAKNAEKAVSINKIGQKIILRNLDSIMAKARNG